MSNLKNDGNSTFVLTRDQQTTLCQHFGKNLDELEEYEVGELLDKLIDDLEYNHVTDKYQFLK